MLFIRLQKSQSHLFSAPVLVAGSVRKDGTHVASYTRIQRVKAKGQQNEEQPSLFDENPASDAQEGAMQNKLDAFLSKHGGVEAVASELAQMTDEQRQQLLDGMAKLAGKDVEEIAAMFKPQVSQEPPAPDDAGEHDMATTNPDIEQMEDREDLATAMTRNPHSEESKQLLRKIARNELEAHEPVVDDDDPNSPNYRFRDTGHIAGSRKELAALNIRQAAREGRRLRATDIDWDEIEQNPRLAEELIKKSNLFGAVDWDGLREGGMEPGAGFLLDRVYASLATEPEGGSALVRKDYAIGLEGLRERLERCKTPEELTDVLDDIRDELNGMQLNESETRRYKALGDEVSLIHGKLNAAKEISDVLYAEMQQKNAEVYRTQHEVEKRERRGWSVKPELLAEREAAKAASEEVGQRWVELRNQINPAEKELRDMARSTFAEREAIMRSAKIRNIAENQATRSWATLGPRFLNMLNWRRHSGSDAFAGHVTAAKNGKIKDWSWAEKEAKAPRATKREVGFQLRVAETMDRVGGRKVDVPSTAALKDAFGLRDVQSGNWVLNDPASAAYHVQRSAEAFADLADLLGVDDKFVAMNGRLAMAFGARGQGNAGFSGAARAHYEPVHRVINLTKMGGGGSLGHEWFHSLDNLAVEAEGAGASGKDVFVTEQPELLPTGELRDSLQALKSAIHTGSHPTPERHKYSERDVRTAKYNIDRATSHSPIARAIKDAGSAAAGVKAVDDYFRTRYGDNLHPRSAKQARDWRRMAVAFYDGKLGGGEVMLNTGRGVSSFMREAIALDGGSEGKYWSKGREMAARAFQSWVEDKLAHTGRKNDYLSSYADNKWHVDPLFGPQYPYPDGDERTALNAAFDRVVAALAASGTLRKAAELVDASGL